MQTMMLIRTSKDAVSSRDARGDVEDDWRRKGELNVNAI